MSKTVAVVCGLLRFGLFATIIQLFFTISMELKMKINKTKGFLMGTGLMLMFSAVQAQSWYAGIGFGNTSIDLSEVEDTVNSAGDVSLLDSIPGVSASFELDDEDFGYKIFGGYNIGENLALEFGYADLGEAKLNLSIIDDGTFTMDPATMIVNAKDSVSGLFGAAVGKVALSENVALQGRIGLYLWDMESEFSVTDTTGFFGSGAESFSDDGNDIFYGVGLNVNWFGLFYEVYDIDGDDVDFLGVSAAFNFQ